MNKRHSIFSFFSSQITVQKGYKKCIDITISISLIIIFRRGNEFPAWERIHSNSIHLRNCPDVRSVKSTFGVCLVKDFCVQVS